MQASVVKIGGVLACFLYFVYPLYRTATRSHIEGSILNVLELAASMLRIQYSPLSGIAREITQFHTHMACVT